MIPTFLERYGRMEKIGFVPATFSALSILDFSITRGMILVPAILSPFLYFRQNALLSIWESGKLL